MSILVRTPPPDLAQHPAAVYLARLAPRSRRTMKGSLQVVAALVGGDFETLDWSALRYMHTQAIRAQLQDGCTPATANRHLAALRGVLKEAWRLGHMNAEDYHRARDLPGIKSETLPRGRALDIGELRALFVQCATNGGAGGARDAALLAIGYGGGLRRSELVALDLDDYRDEGELRVLYGKGRKQRLVYLSNGARAAVDAWILIRGDEPGALLVPVKKGGAVDLRRMGEQSILDTLRRRARQAGVAEFSPHDLRRTYISHMLDNGADIATVRQLAGHSSVETTARYDRRGERTKQQASELLLVPYAPPDD